MRAWILVIVLMVTACGTERPESADGKDDAFLVGGKGDSPYGSCTDNQILALVNDPLTSYEVLRGIGVWPQSAKSIVAHRDGADGLPGTADDDSFDDLRELDDLWWVGPKTLEALATAAAANCEAVLTAEVIFSPQPYEQSHLDRVRKLIDGAEVSIDIAMYSFSDSNILAALGAATARGVQIRFIFESANGDKNDPEGTWSAKLEERGINVRYVNKIMHHKFMIVDGPIASVDDAYTGTLVTGSGNWSNSAGTRYDENTVFLSGSGELLLKFQQEFNHLWENSRDLVWAEDLESLTTLPIPDAVIVDDPAVDVAYTSDNFDVKASSYGPTFSVVTGRDTVADALVAQIEAATTSIHVASGHLRSRPVAEALLAKAAAHPEMDIRVLLDNQEYISAWKADDQKADLAACLAAAGDSPSAVRKCQDKGFYYSYPLYEAGVPLRFKFYCYRWHYTYAVQMHHKTMVFDGRIVASGSYNLSDNAEHNTMENMVFYDASVLPEMVAAFEANFEALWVQGEAEGLYPKLLEEISLAEGPFPIVFEPMALGWEEVTVLKALIKDKCPQVTSDAFASNPQSHTWCDPNAS
ncbi:MAG: phospholipase D-like domain-containing protein [Pseudomonadota bacterium]